VLSNFNQMTNDQIPMTNMKDVASDHIGHWCLNIGHSTWRAITH
jgi:hypothetical protein